MKKIIIAIISISIILFGVEGYVNYSVAELDVCELEKLETFRDLPQDIKNKRCQEIFGLGYVFDSIKQSTEVIHVNSDGFRGTEITLEKPENIYRIFMIGGSTTYGDGIEDSGTMPFFLQQKFDEMDLDFNVQVINAGIPRAFSEGEVKLIKNRLLQYQPDLFVVYDGWNDSAFHQDGITNEDKWFDRWKDICNLGKDKGFDVVITIQPIAGSGDRILTQQEYEYYILTTNEEKLTEIYPLYLEKLHALNDYCTKTADLRGIFDDVLEPIYFDNGHQGARGSEIIAENIFKLISPIVTGNYDTAEDNIEPAEQGTDNVIPSWIKNNAGWWADGQIDDNSFVSGIQWLISNNVMTMPPTFISHMSSVEHFISTTPEKLDWTKSNFLYKNHSGQDLRNYILFDAENIKSHFAWSNLANTNLSGVDLSGWDLRGATLEGADLSYANLDGTKLQNVNLNHAKLEGVNWKPDIDLRNSYLAYTNLSGLDLSSYVFNGSDLSGSNLTNTTLQHTGLIDVDLTDADLSGVDLSETSLVFGVEKTIERSDGMITVYGRELTRADDVRSYERVSFAHFFKTNLANANLSGINLSYINFNHANAENADFSNSVLVHTKLENTNLKNANFQNSYLYKTNFTNADLSGADFSGAEIFDNVILNGAILDCINHPICN